MTSDQLALLIASVVLSLHVGVLVWTGWTRSIMGLLRANLVVAVGVLAFTTIFGGPIFTPVLDVQVIGLATFEVATIAVAVLAHHGWRPARWASVIPFGVHIIASVLALVFFATFRIAHLI